MKGLFEDLKIPGWFSGLLAVMQARLELTHGAGLTGQGLKTLQC